MDERNGNLYFVTADSTTSKPDAAGEETQVYHPNTFVVLTYKPL